MARRRHEEEHENHERWLVSYADFITLLFAFFVVMYAISSVNEGKYRVLSDALESAFRNVQQPGGAVIQVGTAAPPRQLANPLEHRALKPDPRVKEEAARMKKLARSVIDVLQPMVKDGSVRITQSKRGVSVEINASVLFEPARAELNPQTVSALAALAQRLAQADNLIQVQGFTDNHPISSPQYPSNWELSAARASSVARVMEENGVATRRLVVIGYGENRFIEDNTTAEGRARNRRVTIEILADSKEEVAVLE